MLGQQQLKNGGSLDTWGSANGVGTQGGWAGSVIKSCVTGQKFLSFYFKSRFLRRVSRYKISGFNKKFQDVFDKVKKQDFFYRMQGIVMEYTIANIVNEINPFSAKLPLHQRFETLKYAHFVASSI